VFEEDGEVAGFVVAWRVLDELHVADLAVRPERRRRGVARALLEDLKAAGPGVSWIGLEVRASNAAALALYRGLGFSESGVRKGYYADTGEDAVLMAITVSTES
jgi:ribosomal-protein-alanine N-acetyltransferase